MDSSVQRNSLLSISSWMLLIIISSSLLASNPASASASASASRIDLLLNSHNQKVPLAFYYESLCPFCSNFFVNYLNQIFENGIIDIVDLKLVPYGNARLGPNNTVSCQHGPYECLLNTVEACAIDAWPKLDEHFPFILCVESLVYEHKYLQWESCFEKLGLDQKKISDCYNSGYGKELELKYAAETNALRPPHTYVPWVVVNGEPLYEDYENFIIYICKAYKGTTELKVCNELSDNTAQKLKLKPTLSVCHKETITPMKSSIMSWMRKIYTAASM